MQYNLTFEQYQQGLGKGKILGLKCKDCAAITFPAQGVCRDCGSTSLDVKELKREGTIRTFTVIRVAPEGRKPPYIVAMVELEEGAWTIGNLLGVNADEANMGLIGQKVKVGTQSVKGDPTTETPRHVLAFTLK